MGNKSKVILLISMGIFKHTEAGSSMWPKVGTSDLSQIVQSNITFISCVLTAHEQMSQILKSSELMGENMKLLL